MVEGRSLSCRRCFLARVLEMSCLRFMTRACNRCATIAMLVIRVAADGPSVELGAVVRVRGQEGFAALRPVIVLALLCICTKPGLGAPGSGRLVDLWRLGRLLCFPPRLSTRLLPLLLLVRILQLLTMKVTHLPNRLSMRLECIHQISC